MQAATDQLQGGAVWLRSRRLRPGARPQWQRHAATALVVSIEDSQRLTHDHQHRLHTRASAVAAMSDARNHQGRASLDNDAADIEAHDEQSPLLGGERGGSNARAPQDWRDYPAYAWNASTAAVASAASGIRELAASAVSRGKQRQAATGADGEEHRDATDTAEEEVHPSKYQHFKRRHPKTFTSLAISAGIFLLALFLFLVALLHLLFITLRSPDEAAQQRIAQRAISIEGPDKVEVVSVNDKGATVRIDGRIGLDADVALNEWLGERGSRKWWARKERSFVEWAISKVEGVQVEVGTVAVRSPDWSTKRPIDWVDLIPDEDKSGWDEALASYSADAPLQPADLVTINFDPVQVKLPPIHRSAATKDKPEARQPVNLTLIATPSGPNLLAFAERALKDKTAFIDIRVAKARIRGMSGKEWAKGKLRSWLRWDIPGWVDLGMGETWRRVAQKLPKLDGGNGTNTDEFLNLTRYDFAELQRGKDRALGLDIQAEATNPLGKLLAGHVGWSLPFGAYLPLHENSSMSNIEDSVLLAAVATEPLDINGEHKIPLRLHGRVVPPPQLQYLSKRSAQTPLVASGQNKTKDDAGQDALSNFLSRFLRGDPNTLIVRGGSPFRPPVTANAKEDKPGSAPQDPAAPFPGNGDELPPWLDRLLRTMAVPIAFPGSKVTDLIQNVSISDLKITPHPFMRDKLVCSGVITGVMNLPGQLATVNVEITDLWPDVLIFNGKPPSLEHPGNSSTSDLGGMRQVKKPKDGDDDPDYPDPEPVPEPIPKHAFGRVVPHTWSPAETILDPDDPTGQRKLLRSELKNVPFYVLPGRGSEFRSFTWKIVTGEGALAGIDGTSQAKIWNSGLGKLTLSNMPVKGVFTVGKRGSTPGDGDGDGDDGLLVA